MAYQLDLAVLDRAFSGATVIERGKPVPFSTVEVGRLRVTSGQVGASDPFTCPAPPPFTCLVPRGEHPVVLAVAQFQRERHRVAFAQVRIGDQPAVTWAPALVDGQEPSTLGPGEYFGYGVDAGTGCFMDAAAGALLEARMVADPGYAVALIEAMARVPLPACPSATAFPDPERRENVICFASGWGDGVYPSFVGRSATGEVVALVTDFCLITGEEEEPPPRSLPRKA